VRTHRQIVVYDSIHQVLHESGCPFCRLLKEFQATLLQNHAAEDLHHLCNFHAWGLAAVQDAPSAAEAFIKLLDETLPESSGDAACDLGIEVHTEEELRLHELASCILQPEVSHWLRSRAILCVQHAAKLRLKVSFVLIPQIDTIVQNSRRQLIDELHELCSEPEPDRSGWGALGRAAEFLVSQRGLHP
jgi:hypothetical protein